MANNEFMALFGPTSVTANVFSEANAVKYKIVVRGSNNDSAVTDIEVSINDQDIASRVDNARRGINMIVLNADLSVFAYKSFDTYVNTAANTQAVIDYLKSLPTDKLVAIYTYDATLSSQALDDYMYSIGSRAWPTTKFFARRDDSTAYFGGRSSYSALYNCKMRKIAMENFVGNSKKALKEDTRSFVECVFDTFDDVGATGIPERMVDDVTEYSTSTGNSFKQWSDFPNSFGTDFAAGDVFRFTGDLYQDKALVDNGGVTVLMVWFQLTNGSVGASEMVRSSGQPVDAWSSQEGYITVPSGSPISKMFLQAYRSPSTVKAGTSKIRNVTFTKISRLPNEAGTASIGVNGIRLSKMAESGNPVNALLKLPTATAGQDSSKIIMSANFAEMDNIVTDSNTYTGTSGYMFKSYTNGTVLLSSSNIKVGDTLRFSGEFARNPTAISNDKRASLYVQFQRADGTTISSHPIHGNTNIPNVFDFFKSEVVVPAGAVTYDFSVFFFPNNTATGSVSIRNAKLSNNRGA